ncbi:hypothetical protein B6D52_00680 [Candidatus Parcubacteria bacterium 4484_255]|nr:MAG: hypothetical protein B6D52_00680 [Candidatus Parcubacteria bacterium 4484_255]
MENCNKRFLSFFVAISLFLLLFFPLLAVNAQASNPPEGEIILDEELDNFKAGARLGGADLGEIIGKVVKSALGILGLVCVVIFIMAGIQWMTSGGQKEKIVNAQKSMGAAVIGLIIIIGSYAAVHFITEALSKVTTKAS